jgi:hypothetical protein
MLKCNILNEIEHDYIDFHSLPIGETFVIKNTDANIIWIGMKVKEGAKHEFYDEYIMDMSDDVGRLYSDVDKYNIVRLIDLKVVEDED